LNHLAGKGKSRKGGRSEGRKRPLRKRKRGGKGFNLVRKEKKEKTTR